MLPFCGYNMGDYFAHWVKIGQKAGAKLPKIFFVNWFRKGDDGKFLWPGYGDNLRVLEWIIGRCEGTAGAEETPIGNLPRQGDLNLDDLNLSNGAVAELLDVDADGWRVEIADIGTYLDSFGSHTPQRLREEQRRVAQALDAAPHR
jgi:phosphoenolpyruvate carboxykinase (GTP)